MGVVLGLIVVSFAIWGIGDIFRGVGRSTVAQIGRTEIGMEQFRQLFNERLQQLSRQVGRPISMDQARRLGLDQQLLGQIVAEAALDHRVRGLRLGIADSDVIRRITEEPAFRGPSGQFDRMRFEQLIRQAGFSEQRFVAEQRQTILRRQLVATISGEVKAPKAAVEAFDRYTNEQRSIEYIVLDRAQAGEIPPPSPEVLAKYFDARKTLFRAPEYRKVVLLVLTPEELARSIETSADDVKRAYEERKGRYSTPERRQIEQIVFPSADEAKKGAERLAGGLSFPELAKERGLSQKDIDLGLIAKSDMADPTVADAAFSLQQDATSAPINGRFGTVIIRVTKIEPAHTRSFAEVEDELKRDLAIERAKSELATLRDKIEDELASGLRLDEVAQKLKLSSRTIDAIDRSGRAADGQQIANLPQGVDVVASAFAAEVGVENDSLQLPGGGYLWYDVTGITPSRDRSLDEVKDKVEERWRTDEIITRLDAKSKEVVEALKVGTPLSEVASVNKVELKKASGLKRQASSDALSSQTVGAVFLTGKGAARTAEGKNPTERVVFRVTDIVVPTFDPQSPETKRIGDTLRNAVADGLLSQYVARIETDIGVTINQSALNQSLGAASAN